VESYKDFTDTVVRKPEDKRPVVGLWRKR